MKTQSNDSALNYLAQAFNTKTGAIVGFLLLLAFICNSGCMNNNTQTADCANNQCIDAGTDSAMTPDATTAIQDAASPETNVCTNYEWMAEGKWWGCSYKQSKIQCHLEVLPSPIDIGGCSIKCITQELSFWIDMKFTTVTIQAGTATFGFSVGNDRVDCEKNP